MRILLAEDEKDLNRVIEKKLKSEGYSVDACYNGEDAWHCLEMAEYAAVILDIMMPGRDGYEVLELMRKRGIQTPVIFLTAKDTIEDKVTGLDLGANDYLVKPFSFRELMARLRVMTRISSGNQTNRYEAGDLVMEFGLRRAQGPDAGLYGARAALIAGCGSTSNVLAGQLWDVPVAGTHAHSWVMSFPDELTAFRAYAQAYPDACLLLVDTYDTLHSGMPNAIRVFHELRAKGHEPLGIRLDSGDLAYLSRQARRMMDEAGFPNAKVCASGDLDENVIWDLKQQGACIDSWGVGTRMITSDGCPALGGVYKMSAEIIDGQIVPKIKVSENPAKVTNPGYKKVQRIYNREGMAMADIIMLDHETIDTAKPLTIFHPVDTWKRQTYTDYTLRDLLVPVFVDGECVYTCPKLSEIQSYCKNEISTLWEQYRRRLNPHVYKVDLSYELYALRHQLLNAARTEQGDIPPMQ